VPTMHACSMIGASERQGLMILYTVTSCSSSFDRIRREHLADTNHGLLLCTLQATSDKSKATVIGRHSAASAPLQPSDNLILSLAQSLRRQKRSRPQPALRCGHNNLLCIHRRSRLHGCRATKLRRRLSSESKTEAKPSEGLRLGIFPVTWPEE
jgi:hypothetical protein